MTIFGNTFFMMPFKLHYLWEWFDSLWFFFDRYRWVYCADIIGMPSFLVKSCRYDHWILWVFREWDSCVNPTVDIPIPRQAKMVAAVKWSFSLSSGRMPFPNPIRAGPLNMFSRIIMSLFFCWIDCRLQSNLYLFRRVGDVNLSIFVTEFIKIRVYNAN